MGIGAHVSSDKHQELNRMADELLHSVRAKRFNPEMAIPEVPVGLAELDTPRISDEKLKLLKKNFLQLVDAQKLESAVRVVQRAQVSLNDLSVPNMNRVLGLRAEGVQAGRVMMH